MYSYFCIIFKVFIEFYGINKCFEYLYIYHKIKIKKLNEILYNFKCKNLIKSYNFYFYIYFLFKYIYIPKYS